MALERQDVLTVLADPLVGQIDFWVDSLHVGPKSFLMVRSFIADGDIIVAHGTSAHNAYYNSHTNTLTTQNVPPPADASARALLLHECCHALIDISKTRISSLNDEVTSYLAQHTYLLLTTPGYVVSPNNAPWFNWFTTVVDFVKKHELHKPAGRGKKFKLSDLQALATQLNGLNLYQHLKPSTMAPANGVPVKIPMSPEPVRIHQTAVAYETYPQPTDDFLIDVLARRYRADDVKGYGGRIRLLEDIFNHATKPLAAKWHARLNARKPGDKMSIYFHDHLSTATRTKLLQILAGRK